MLQEVRKGEELDKIKILNFFFDNNLISNKNIKPNIQQFSNGYSNLTYLINFEQSNFVLRCPPKGAVKKGHDMSREYNILSKLNTSFNKVPKTYIYNDDLSILNSPFYVMEMVEGNIYWEPTIPEVDNELRAKIYIEKNKTLSDLHNTNYKDIGLEDFGKPGNYFSRQISRWTKQYIASETEKIIEMNKLIDWLPNNIPGDDETSIVHGDYRLDNMVIDRNNSKVLAVLDWELSTLGHPLGDFTYHLMQWYMPGDGTGAGTQTLSNTDLKSIGVPSAEDYIKMYCDNTNRKEIENIDFYISYNFFRLAGILQGIIGRVRDGTAASEHAEDRSDRVRPLAESGWFYAQKAGAV